MIRIYVACLAAYNNGRLHGTWIDATQDPQDIWAEVQAMLAASPEPSAEEWAIHDFEGFAPLRLNEHDSFERVSAIAQGIEEHGEAFAAWLATDDSIDLDLDDFSEAYVGTWDSEKDYAYSYVDSAGGWAGVYPIPDELEPYLDWDAIASDLMQDHFAVRLSNHSLAIFRSSSY